MRIAMVGTGYVGLVTGACFSEFGWQVSCIDRDTAKIAKLLAGEIPIYEPGLERLVATNRKLGGSISPSIWDLACVTPMQCSLPLARRRGAARAMRISLTCVKPPRRSPPTFRAIRWW